MGENITNDMSKNSSYDLEYTQYNPYYIFKDTCSVSSDKKALVYKEDSYTAKEVLQLVHNFIYFIQNQNMHLSNSVLYSAKNHPLLLISYLSCAYLGLSFSPINPLLSKRDKSNIFNELQPLLHITDQNLDEYYSKCFESINHTTSIDDTVTKIKNPSETKTNNIGAILYTSGSSGKPKGVKLSYKNLWWGTKNLRLGFKYTYEDVALVVAPMSHIGGFNGCTIDLLINGGTVVIAENLQADYLLDILEKEKVTLMFAVPTLYEKILLAHTSQDLSNLSLPLTGGSPVPKTLISKAKNHGLNLLPVWGMTEISASGTYLPQNLVTEKPNNVGLPFPHVDIQILSLESKTPITTNSKIGEIAVKGPSVSSGYLNHTEHDEEHFHNGFLLTKDLGCWFEDKFVQITGRKSELIISGGEHVFPNEIDEILQSHTEITMSKTFSVPDKYWGEKIISAIVPTIPSQDDYVLQDSISSVKHKNLDKENNFTITKSNNLQNISFINKLTKQEYKSFINKKTCLLKDDSESYLCIKNYLKTTLSKYKIPKEIIILGSMPLLPNGKIDTNRLTEIYTRYI